MKKEKLKNVITIERIEEINRIVNIIVSLPVEIINADEKVLFNETIDGPSIIGVINVFLDFSEEIPRESKRTLSGVEDLVTNVRVAHAYKWPWSLRLVILNEER